MNEGGPVRTLAVWCGDWPAVATGRPPHVPVAVVRANRVRAVSPAARSEGVEVGQRRREAQSRCPVVEVHEFDEQRDARAFEVVLGALEDLAPRLEVTAPGRCAVPTRGPSRYHGGDRALAGLVLDRVRAALGRSRGEGRSDGEGSACRVGVAVADGPRAAALLAHDALIRGPDSPVVVPAGATAAALAPLPVRRLVQVGPGRTGEGRSEDLPEVLARLGLRTLGHLAALEPADVLARFGADGLDAHRLVSGREDRPPRVTDPPADLAVAAELDPPAERVDRAAFAAKALADEFHERLSARGLACTRVLVVAETELGDRIERLWRHEGGLSAAAVAQRMRWQLEGWLGSGRTTARCRGGVSRLELVPDEVVGDTGRQLGFWGGSSEAGERAVRALARVQALAGPDAVRVPEWRGGRAPSERYRLVPLDSVDLAGRAEPGPEPWPGSLPVPSPALVWPAPRPAGVLDAAGRQVVVGGRGLASAPPARCSLDGGAWTEVRSWAGPWCTDERWWDPLGHRRRARVQLVLADGTAHLLTLESGRWWWEAAYD
ncbi:MAG: DNA polymerase Y family protein [Microthrixaceae bacterium]